MPTKDVHYAAAFNRGGKISTHVAIEPVLCLANGMPNPNPA